jgi:hypothetical protein
MGPKIFINYRRGDSANAAGRLHDRLAQSFGPENVFIDVEHIPGGADVETHINHHLTVCDVFLVIIGPNWLSASDERGRRRLHAPNDFVALEIAEALARTTYVIPTLVDGAVLPKAAELPESLSSLTRRNAVELRHTSFSRDVDALIADIQRYEKRLRERERLLQEAEQARQEAIQAREEANRLRAKADQIREKQAAHEKSLWGKLENLVGVLAILGLSLYGVYWAIKWAYKHHFFLN